MWSLVVITWAYNTHHKEGKKRFLEVYFMNITQLLFVTRDSWSVESLHSRSCGPCNFAQVTATRGTTACCDAGCKHAVWSLCHHCAWIYLLLPYCFQLTCCSHCLHRAGNTLVSLWHCLQLWEARRSLLTFCASCALRWHMSHTFRMSFTAALGGISNIFQKFSFIIII